MKSLDITTLFIRWRETQGRVEQIMSPAHWSTYIWTVLKKANKASSSKRRQGTHTLDMWPSALQLPVTSLQH